MMTRLPIVPSRLSAGMPGLAVPSQPSPASELYLVARVGTERFAFPVAQVEMVVDAPHLSWVPGAPDGLLGQMRHRDRTVRAFAAGWALGVPPAADTDPRSGTALILRVGELRVAVVVDDAEDLQMVPAETVRSAPVGADPEGVLRGVCCSLGGGRDVVGLVVIDALVARVTADAALASLSAR
jgi:chemotaxis signal transduction protein